MAENTIAYPKLADKPAGAKHRYKKRTIDAHNAKLASDPVTGELGELGFGTQRLPVSGRDIQDEKILGTLHVASDAPGAAASYDLTLAGTSNEVPVANDARVIVTAGVQRTIAVPATDSDGDTLNVSGTTPGANLAVDGKIGRAHV